MLKNIFASALLAILSLSFALPQPGYSQSANSPSVTRHVLPNRAKLAKLLLNDKFRSSLEAKMTAADAQAFETAVQNLKSRKEEGLSVMERLKNDRSAKDTAAVRVDRGAIRDLWQAARPDIKTVRTLLRKYRSQLTSLTGKATAHSASAITASVYPNPLHLTTSEGATLSYNVQADAPVHITLSDANGKTIRDLVNDNETGGDHTLAITPAGLQSGLYLIRLEIGGSARVEKLQVVQ